MNQGVNNHQIIDPNGAGAQCARTFSRQLFQKPRTIWVNWVFLEWLPIIKISYCESTWRYIVSKQASFSLSQHGSFLEVFNQKKLSSWFLNVIILHFVHWFQNCAQLNQSPNIPGFSLADNSNKADNQQMRNQEY